MDAIVAFLQHAWQNILVGRGLEITVVGIVITFSALTITSLFITAVPRMLELFNSLVPPPETKKPVVNAIRQTTAVDQEIAAAIGVAFHSFNSAKKQ